MIELAPIPLFREMVARSSRRAANFSRGRGIKSSWTSNRNSYSPISGEQFNQRAPDRRERKKKTRARGRRPGSLRRIGMKPDCISGILQDKRDWHRGDSPPAPSPSRLVLVRLRGPRSSLTESQRRGRPSERDARLRGKREGERLDQRSIVKRAAIISRQFN